MKNKKFRGTDKSLMEINYRENVSEPWFTLISLGIKTIEGRLNKNRFKEMKISDIVEWSNNDFGPRSVLTRIVKKTNYDSFENYLRTEGMYKCLPGIDGVPNGLNVYYKYYTKENEKEFGVIAIQVELVSLS